MTSPYEPQKYWEQRLSNSFSLRRVGHISYSDGYNTWLYRRKRKCIQACLREIPLNGRQVLDIGSGTGFFVQWYLDNGAVVSGLDITHTSVERLKNKFKGSFFVQDIGDPLFQSLGLFDIVNMWDVIYHIVAPEPFRQAFTNIAKSLKPGGLLLFTDWFGAPFDIRIADHVQARCLATYNQLLPQLGFQMLSTSSLYHLLNKAHIGFLDNQLGWLYFLLDNTMNNIPQDNISLGLWRYAPEA